MAIDAMDADMRVQGLLERVVALHDLCELLAAMLEFSTLQACAQGLASGALCDDAGAMLVELGLEDRLKDLAMLVAGPKDTYDAVRREHTRLFDHPDRPAVPRYEGAFINRRARDDGREAPDHDVLFVNRAALDAERNYRSAGMQPSAGINVPADNIATELVYLGELMEARAQALVSADIGEEVLVDGRVFEFVRLHARSWWEGFFEAVGAEGRIGYFKIVSLLGCALVEALRADYSEAFAARYRAGRMGGGTSRG